MSKLVLTQLILPLVFTATGVALLYMTFLIALPYGIALLAYHTHVLFLQRIVVWLLFSGMLLSSGVFCIYVASKIMDAGRE